MHLICNKIYIEMERNLYANTSISLSSINDLLILSSNYLHFGRRIVRLFFCHSYCNFYCKSNIKEFLNVLYCIRITLNHIHNYSLIFFEYFTKNWKKIQIRQISKIFAFIRHQNYLSIYERWNFSSTESNKIDYCAHYFYNSILFSIFEIFFNNKNFAK